MARRNSIQFNQASIFRILAILGASYFLFICIRSAQQSHLFTTRDRVTVVFYGEHPSVVSIGYSDSVNYIGFFDQGAAVYVPGGYGQYKIGALGKLVELDHKPQILQRAFSSILSSYVDFYFYPKKSTIYSFDEPDPSKREFFIPKLSFLDVIFPYHFNTNAGFFDRLHIYISMLHKKRSDFSRLKIRTITDDAGDRIFAESRFDKKYQGYFYEQKLRSESKSVQILYKNYKSAVVLTRIIEGEGIRVSDLSKDVSKGHVGCIINENQEPHSYSALFLKSILHCTLKSGKSDTADIVLDLGEAVEKNWE